jgi:hypothetical protein
MTRPPASTEFVRASRWDVVAAERAESESSAAGLGRQFDEADKSLAASHPEAIPALLLAVEADAILGDFDSAHLRLRLCSATLAQLRGEMRDSAQLAIQTQQLNLALREGNFELASMLCLRAFRPDLLRKRDPETASRYARQCVVFFRELGLFPLAMDLTDYIESALLPAEPGPCIETKLTVHFLRISVALRCTGRGLRNVGPLGWDLLPATRAKHILWQTLAQQPKDIAKARALGRDTYAAMADSIQSAVMDHQAHTVPARIELARKKLAFLRQKGYREEEARATLELTGLLVQDEQFEIALHELRKLDESNELVHQSPFMSEELHWHTYLCMRGRGNAAAALRAYKAYAKLVDARRKVATGVLAAGSRWQPSWMLDRSGSRPVRAKDGDGDDEARAREFKERLALLSLTAKNVDELAVGFGVAVRRLQQLFKLYGLPTPSRYLRDRAKTRAMVRRVDAYAASEWGGM